MAIDWNMLLGEFNTERTRAQAQSAYDQMVSGGVGEALALELTKRLYAKAEVVTGEAAQVIADAIAKANTVETADIKGFEKRGVAERYEQHAHDVANGVKTANQVRAEEGYGPIPELLVDPSFAKKDAAIDVPDKKIP